MTSPIDRLASLSISNRMSQRTRAEAQQARRRREAEERRDLQNRQAGGIATTLPRPDAEGMIFGNTNLRYHVQSLPSPSRPAAIRGLTADNIRAEIAKIHTNASGAYVAIQMVERLRLCIYSTPQDGRRVQCSCAESRNRQNPCPHVYWLYDRVNATHRTPSPDPPVPLNLPQIEQALEPITRRSSIELERLPEEISPVWVEPDEDVDHEVEDVLAVLDGDRNRLPDSYDEDFYEGLPESLSRNFRDLVVPGNLLQTIFGLARHDPILRDRLACAVPRETCDKDVLRKINRGQKLCFNRLSVYKRDGPTLDAGQVGYTAVHLAGLMQTLSDYRRRVHELPHLAFDRACAKLAIKILRRLCDWDVDIYVRSTWLEDRPPASLGDRNLFYRLSSGWNQTPPDQAGFLLDFLCKELPYRASVSYRQDLNDALAHLRQHNFPSRLLSKLEVYTQNLASQPQQPLAELENYQSLSSSSSSRHSHSSSSSSNASCSTDASQVVASSSTATQRARRPSTLEMPEPQRRRLE